MKTGKITATNKQLEEHDIPDRFRKRMLVWIFGKVDRKTMPMKYISYVCPCDCHDEFYYCGDIDDDPQPYMIPVEWVIVL